jgi:hypothetical protein
MDAAEDGNSMLTSAGAYRRLAVYDLLGALFAPSDRMHVSLQTEKLFRRVCGIVEDRFSDPDLGPSELAAEAGISLR